MLLSGLSAEVTLSQKLALVQEIRLGSPDCFSLWKGGVWGRDYGKGAIVKLLWKPCVKVNNFWITSLKTPMNILLLCHTMQCSLTSPIWFTIKTSTNQTKRIATEHGRGRLSCMWVDVKWALLRLIYTACWSAWRMKYVVSCEKADVACTVNRKRFGIKLFCWPRYQRKLEKCWQWTIVSCEVKYCKWKMHGHLVTNEWLQHSVH